jgi:hypothetical protein
MRTAVQVWNAHHCPSVKSLSLPLNNPAGPRATRGFPFFACALRRIFWQSNSAEFGRFLERMQPVIDAMAEGADMGSGRTNQEDFCYLRNVGLTQDSQGVFCGAFN